MGAGAASGEPLGAAGVRDLGFACAVVVSAGDVGGEVTDGLDGEWAKYQSPATNARLTAMTPHKTGFRIRSSDAGWFSRVGFLKGSWVIIQNLSGPSLGS